MQIIKKSSLLFFCITLVSLIGFSIPHSFAAQKIVVIDPGHGSAANKRAYEGNTELQTGLKLKQKLEKAGYKVLMTRTTNGEAIGGVKSGENDDNIARASFANSANADLVIRLHSDDYRYKEDFWAVFPDKKGQDRTGFSGPVNDSVVPESTKFAKELAAVLTSDGHPGITKGESTYSSSSKGDLLIFSAHSKVPVVTLEVYGSKNATLRNKYAQSATQDKVANSIAKAINNYLGSSSPSSSSSTTTSAAPTASAVPLTKPLTLICPKDPPKPGPGDGQDYRNAIAQRFIQELGGGEGISGSFVTSFYAGALPAASNELSRVALQEVGKRYSDDITPYGPRGEMWCAHFATWVYRKAGLSLPRIASSQSLMSWFGSNSHTVFSDPAQAGPGDVVVWKRTPNGGGHTGVVVQNDTAKQTIVTVEGNNSANEVRAYTYSYSAIRGRMMGLIGFGRW